MGEQEVDRVAVVVFVDVPQDGRGDLRNQVNIAERAVADALVYASNSRDELDAPYLDPEGGVKVRHVVDAASAVLNGFLRVGVTEPGWKAWVHAGVDQPRDDG